MEFIHKETFKCAYQGQCIPCFYKIFPLHKSKLHPNQRPEMCPRSKNKDFVDGLYSANKLTLTVGDGDFSFSLSLSNGLPTSYESGETVCSVYPNAAQNIRLLKSKGVPVIHDVDAANLEQSELLTKDFRGRLDVIVWNFPCKRAEYGADAQVDDIEENKELLRGFFRCSKVFLKSEESEIHLTHKTLEPFCWWNIIEIGRECGFHCEGTVVFDRYLYPGYINRKALDRKSFPFNDARTYIFTQRIVTEAIPSILNTKCCLHNLLDKKRQRKLRELTGRYSDGISDTTESVVKKRKRST